MSINDSSPLKYDRLSPNPITPDASKSCIILIESSRRSAISPVELKWYYVGSSSTECHLSVLFVSPIPLSCPINSLRGHCYWPPDKLPLIGLALQMDVISYLPNPAFHVLSIYFLLIAMSTHTHTLGGWMSYSMFVLSVDSWSFQSLNRCDSGLGRRCSRRECLSPFPLLNSSCSTPMYFIFSSVGIPNISKGDNK